MKKGNRVKSICSVLLPALLLVLSASPALAHKVKVFAYGEGEKIVTKSYFSNGKAVVNASLIVENNSTGETLLQGKTGTDGLFEFPVPAGAQRGKADLKIILNTGEGHRAEWLLPAEEYLEDDKREIKKETAASTSMSGEKNEEHNLSSAGDKSSCNEEVVARIVEDTLDRKLAPLKAMLQDSRDSGPGLRDIVGGVGYIVGLAGVVAYMSSRKKNRS